MKSRKLIILSVCMLVALGIFFNVQIPNSYAATEKTLYEAYTIKNVIIRRKATDNSKNLEKLNFCEKVSVIGEEENGWLKVKTPSGTIGYIAEEKVSEQKPYKAYAIKSVIVRRKAKDNSKKLQTLQFAEKLTVIRTEKNGWIKIRTSSGTIGYVAKEKVSKQKPYKAYTIKSVIIRRKATDNSKCLEKLDYCKKLTVIEKVENGWIKVRTSSGTIGYVAKEKVSKQKPYKAYTLKTLKVRRKATDNSKNLETIDFCKKVTVAERENGWARIRTASGKIGYVLEENLSKNKPYINKKGFVAVTTTLSLRNSASSYSGIKETLDAGEIVNILSEENNWYKVSTNAGNVGFVSKDYIRTSNSKKEELLVTYTTYSKGSPANRNFNIARACGKITGKKLRPGEEFNWFNVVGSCGGQNGYKQATVIINGIYKQDFGGGVCQVATTLCGVAKRLGSTDIYARPHSNHVSYLNGDGVEAAVSYGSKNFKFRNTTGNTIKLEMYSANGRVIAAAYKVY